ncbi:unnamed protein product [Closterium sp. NIES-53]
MAYISRCRELRDKLLRCRGSISEDAFVTVIIGGLGPQWCATKAILRAHGRISEAALCAEIHAEQQDMDLQEDRHKRKTSAPEFAFHTQRRYNNNNNNRQQQRKLVPPFCHICKTSGHSHSTTQEFKLYHGRGGLYIGKAILKNNVFVLDFVPDLGTADSDGIVTFTSWTHPPDLDPDFSPEGFWYSHSIPEAERTRALATIQHSAAAETTSAAAETTSAAAETTSAAAGTPTTLTPPVADSSTASPHIDDISPTPAQQLTPTPREVHRSANFTAAFYSNSDLYRRSPGHRASEDIWHARMGHPTDLPHRPFTSHHNPGAPTYAPLEKVYSDILYNREPGQGAYSYTITFIDAATRYVWHLNLPSKDMAFEAFIAWLPVAERESGEKLKSFQSDGGGEYTSQRFKQFLVEKGIKRLVLLPYAHQQQGVAERLNRTLQNTMRKLLRGMRLPNHQWPEAMDHAVMLHNLLSSSSLLNNASPHLLWTGKQGNTKMLRVFGCMAPRLWQQYLHARLIRIGFKQLPHDQGMYRLSKDEDYILLIVYVDDLLYIGSTDTVATWFEGELEKDLSLTVSSTVTQYLGLNIEEGENAIYLNAAKYADTIAKRFALTPTTISTPYRYTAGNDKRSSTLLKFAGIRSYQRKLGCLLLAAVTCRPDLSYSASQLATYLKKPEIEHLAELDRALHYFVSTPTIGLTYYKNASTPTELVGYVDADHAGDSDNRRSRTGYIYRLESIGPISWQSSKQNLIALLSAEAEYIALCSATKEGLYLRELLEEAKLAELPNFTLFCDNQSAIHIANKSGFANRTKHIALRYFFMKDEIKKGRLKLSYCPTSEMAADYLTKKLGKSKFEYCMLQTGQSHVTCSDTPEAKGSVGNNHS